MSRGREQALALHHLFREIEAAIADDPASDRARALARRWREATAPERVESIRQRAAGPAGMRHYIASLYDATPEAFDRVAAFLVRNNTPAF